MGPSVQDIAQLALTQYPKLKNYIQKTPILYSSIDPSLLIKCENLQFTGSFKLRGATSKLLQLQSEKVHDIITASTGNHGLAVAKLAKELGMDLQLFVPESIIATKEKKLSKYDVTITKVAGDSDKAEITARKLSETKGVPFVSPYNDPYVIAGQGSIALELDEQIDLQTIGRIYITIGGGGLISGIGSVIKKNFPLIEIIGCQPQNSAAMYAAVKSGGVIEIDHLPTLSDGSAGGMERDTITFDLAKEVVDRFVLISEEEIRNGLRLAYEHHNSIIEGAAAVALAGFLKDLHDDHKKSIVIWCGANIDLTTWFEIINSKA